VKIEVQVLFVEPKIVAVFMQNNFVGSVQLKDIVEGCDQVKILFCKKIDCSPDYCYFKSKDGMTVGVPSDFLASKIGKLFDPVMDKMEADGFADYEGIILNIDRMSLEITKEQIESVTPQEIKIEEESVQESEETDQESEEVEQT